MYIASDRFRVQLLTLGLAGARPKYNANITHLGLLHAEASAVGQDKPSTQGGTENPKKVGLEPG